MRDPFKYKTEPEIKKQISDFWEGLEYLVKLRILLREFDKFNITKIEERGISKLWQGLSLQRKKEIYQYQYKYQI